MANEQTRKVLITKIIRETHDARSLVLEPLDGHIVARSGQFLTFLFRSSAGTIIRRSYSLSSSPELGEPLTVTIKRVANGEISRKMVEQVHEGNLLHTIGASGLFVLPANYDQFETAVFFAAGSGITPIFSLIKTTLRLHATKKIILIYSNRNIADTLFHDELRKLQDSFSPRFDVHFLYSLSQDLNRSRLTPLLLENFMAPFQGKLDRQLYFVCGPNDYMRMIQFTLVAMGAPIDHIRREIFNVLRPATIPQPPDTDEHRVQIISGDTRQEIRVKYPVSILQAARSANIPIPFSCETGQCGTCVAKCLQGEVWMSRNEILLQEDIKRGIVLTCTGYPVNGDVTIKI